MFTRQLLDRLDATAVGLHGEHEARANGLAVDKDRARPADAVLTAHVCTGQPDVVTKEVAEQEARLDRTVDALRV
jgi:hypothetical protein